MLRGDFVEILIFGPLALAPTPPSFGWWWGRPWETMIQTSKTKSETTSFLKHPKEDPLGTITTLLGLWVMWGGACCHGTPTTSHPDGTGASLGSLMKVLLTP